MARKPTRLERAYRTYNKKYFGNLLPNPPEVTVKWEEMDLMGYQEEDKIAINRNDRTSTRVWRFTLLHEMVHLYLRDKKVRSSHGRPFQSEMLRLAQAGAFQHLW